MNALFKPTTKLKVYLSVIIIILSFMVTALVYFTGGIQYAYSHMMYIPIIISAVLFGVKGGLVSGLLGGALLGPFMPVDVSSNYMQETVNWVVRIMFFVIIGCVTGYFTHLIKKHYLDRIYFHSHLPDAQIPLITKLYEKFNNMTSFDNNSSVLIYVKIINFNNLNDFLGHQKYINILGEMYQRLSKKSTLNGLSIYSKDIQSFIIHTYSDKEMRSINEIIHKLFDNPFYTENVPIHLETVIGSSTYTESLEKTLQHSVTAARYAEKNHYQHTVYKEKYDESDLELVYLGSLLEGLKDNDLFLVFQPQHDTKTSSKICLEALLRWKHKTLGLIPPNEFIPVIEKTSLINPLTEWVIKQSLKAIKILEKNNIDVTIAINISTKNLFQENFFEKIKDLLDAYQVQPHQIEFEITESSLMFNPVASVKALKRFKEYGIKLSIDDFGTGYSSLAYLSKFSVHKLKIDRAFISNLENDDTSKTIIDTAVYLANKLNILTVAEGVETKYQLKLLSDFGCNYTQGYLWTKPIVLDEMITYLNKQT